MRQEANIVNIVTTAADIDTICGGFSGQPRPVAGGDVASNVVIAHLGVNQHTSKKDCDETATSKES